MASAMLQFALRRAEEMDNSHLRKRASDTPMLRLRVRKHHLLKPACA